ncbi:MAG: sensor histidine kinase, partial [Alteromonadales bacterium]|nr:sensor histidine kinase [Alteromonadales bacterium]
SIIQDRKTIYEKYSASFSSKALTIAERTVGILSSGFNEENTQKIAKIIYEETGVGAVSITDREKILAFIGIGGDHHLPGTMISSLHTKHAIQSGELIFADGYEVAYQCSIKQNCKLGSALIIPLLDSENRVLGTIKLYEPKQKLFSSLNHSLGEGLAKLLSNHILSSRYLEQQTLLTQAELRLLQAQVNPHFLFNALNTISAVIRRDPDRARQLIQHLSQFFRRNLKHNIESVKIEDELKHIHAYLEIELARFSDRLKININIEEPLLSQYVPSFTLQPLVENAIKHGTSTLLENGVIDVMGYLENGVVVLKVIDNAGTYCLSDKELQTGLGLQIVDKRIKNSFGEEYGLTMLCQTGVSTCAEIKFPLLSEKS